MSRVDAFLGRNETIPGITLRHDVYPTIDTTRAISGQTYSGKVVLVTDISCGIGLEIARQYARAGAKLAITSRTLATLEANRDAILEAVPSAEVLVVPVDIRDKKRLEAAVHSALEVYGRLDILIANAEKAPDASVDSIEVNIRGVFNSICAAVRALQNTQGCIVVISSGAFHDGHSGGSGYNTSKTAVGRLVEFLALGVLSRIPSPQRRLSKTAVEYPTVTAFALDPGLIEQKTLEKDIGVDGLIPDKLALPAATVLYLTAGGAHWLTGRHVSANWDLGEAEKEWKARILEESGNTSKGYTLS
ncbi:NAD-P-binding protein [Artomyces pyxidatus]|uniref:NAD-P-binding protein n=1 Tax=Artomyces pyxidatus TaxID=48021 RepID=A0ACB8TFY1_9AGAM|nr:NAD-P-binding protein [Artomyces pyxidatus]